MAATTETDVFIIGGGPTGGALALELAVQNIPFRIIDKAETRSNKSRALVVQPRTLELFSRHGSIDDYTSQGLTGFGVIVHVNKKRAGELRADDLGLTDTMFTGPMFVSQVETECWLDQRLKGHGQAVEFGVNVDNITQDEDGVSLSLTNANGDRENVRAKYVVGADGAHSIVRHTAGLSFEGGAYLQDFILCDTRVRNWDHPSDRFMMFMGHGTLVVFPLKDGIVRIICIRPINIAAQTEPTLEDFQKCFDEMVPGSGELYDPVWVTRFRLHHRGVNAYRAGRLFVAGDAAHIHSPAGGQGMNTGIQDSINLAWKLARVLRGEKDDKFLDSYNTERLPIGKILLKGTDRMFEWATWMNPGFLYLRNFLVPWVMPWVVSSRDRRQKMFQFILQFGVNYRGSPLAGNAKGWKGSLRGGDRAPNGRITSQDGKEWLLQLCTPSKYLLILFSGALSDAVSEEELVKEETRFRSQNPDSANVAILHGGNSELKLKSAYGDLNGGLHARYGFKKPGYVYLRPDGYIAHIGPLSSLDELMTWLKKD